MSYLGNEETLVELPVIMTTIQKFENETKEREVIENGVKTTKKFIKEYEVLTTKSNVIVLADEAHRNHYKAYVNNSLLPLAFE